jgi:leucyl-tRNA synthetase
MFMGPYEIGGDFSDRGIGGVVRFLDRVWQLVTTHTQNASRQEPQNEAKRAQHQTIKRVTEEIAALKYNTTVAALMEYLNTLEARQQQVTRAELQTLLILLAPFAPFLAEELWERMGNTFSIHKAAWPGYNPAALHTENIMLIVQVNGRVRDRIEVNHDTSEEEIQREALASDKVQRFIDKQQIQRVVYVPGRLVNIVAR